MRTFVRCTPSIPIKPLYYIVNSPTHCLSLPFLSWNLWRRGCHIPALVTPTTKPRRRTTGFNLQRCVFAATALVCGTSPPKRRLCHSSPYACYHAGAYGKSGLVAIHVVCVLARRRTRVNSIIRLRQPTYVVCVLARRRTRVIFRNRLTMRTALLSTLLVESSPRHRSDQRQISECVDA